MPIQSFRHKALKRLFEESDARGLPAGQTQKLLDVLAALDTAEEPNEVGLFPGWRLHPLKGARKGFWSVTITGNWRVIFRFDKGDVFDVDFIDYH
ncbi:MAG: peptidase [Acidobacteria bacterium RIFCSPLOWO2_12_FULL_60_22]|nr:MAG: peptidase [Acidobacteria bacterium RIFCSPLOWO2_12_FULL_60_22]